MRSVLFGAGFALAFTLFMTPVFIKLFERLGWGQFIRDDGPQSHHTKRGTPTKGGPVLENLGTHYDQPASARADRARSRAEYTVRSPRMSR